VDLRAGPAGARQAVSPSRRAFTLVEVIVALAIFGLVAVVLGAAYLNVLNSYAVMGRGSEDAQDIGYARQELLTQPDLQTAENGDEFDTATGKHVQWTADIQQANTTDLFTVTFTCQITSPQGQPHNDVETFMLLRPTWSDPTDQSTLRQTAATRIAVAQGLQAQ
jgi:prepilin-type N-terminal cleavage/methylation domain-containing protein